MATTSRSAPAASSGGDRDSPPFPRSALRRALIGTAAVTVVGLWLAFGSLPYVQVNIKWSADVPRATREDAARARSLRFLREDDPDVWTYVLSDTSRANIAAIFSIPGVQSIRFLNRTTLRPEYSTASPVQWLDKHGYFEGANFTRLVRPVAIAPVAVLALLLALMRSREGRQWLVARIPKVSPVSMGVFRAAFAFALLPLVSWTVTDLQPTLRFGCLTLLLMFGTGTFARASLIAFVILFSIAHAGEIGNHDFALPIRTLLLLTLVPWGAGFSVDETVRRLAGKTTPPSAGRRYGLATWIPMLMLGSAYAAAAFAKIDQSGRQWLMGGAARYFFVVDGPGAPGHLWKTVAASDWLSFVLSAGGVLTEATIIAAAIWCVPSVTLVAGAGVMLLHLGFWFLQGHWWYGWWALLVAFLPWHAAVSWLQQALPELTLLTDGRCKTCRLTARLIHAGDWFDRVSLKSSDPALQPDEGVAAAARERSRHVCVVGGAGQSVECGYDAYARLFRVLPLLWPFLPVLLFPPVVWLGRRLSTRVSAESQGAEDPAGTDAASSPRLTSPRTAGVDAIPLIAAAVLSVVVLQQPVVSLLLIEYPPFLSNFPMYAHVNWQSKEEFAADMERQFQPKMRAVRLAPLNGLAPSVLDERVEALGATEPLADAARLIASGETLDEHQSAALRDIAQRYQERFGDRLPPMEIFTTGWRFDWSVAGFVPKSDWSPQARLDLTALRDSSEPRQ
jgi:hypothetical protein